jgi:hypothetical protein
MCHVGLHDPKSKGCKEKDGEKPKLVPPILPAPELKIARIELGRWKEGLNKTQVRCLHHVGSPCRLARA